MLNDHPHGQVHNRPWSGKSYHIQSSRPNLSRRTQLTVSSRQNFALSRDGVLPFSRYIYALNMRSGSPIYSVWVSGAMAAIVGLLSFAGPAALGAIFSVGVIGQYVADSVPIVARFWGGQPFKPGPFHLGRFVRIEYNMPLHVT